MQEPFISINPDAMADALRHLLGTLADLDVLRCDRSLANPCGCYVSLIILQT